MNKIFYYRPYMTSDFQMEGHLLRIWFELCGLTYKGEEPQFFLSKVEKQFYKTAYQHKTNLAIQPNGSASNQNMYYNWARDIPNKLAKIINRFKKIMI